MTYVEKLPAPLLADLIAGRCLPIIGAGFSLNADVPTGKQMLAWSGLGRALAEQMNYPETTPLEAISAYEYMFSRSPLIEEVRRLLLIEHAKPGPAHLAFCRLPFDIVCTTNFDFLLERAYEAVQRPCQPVVEQDQLAVRSSPSQVTLVKLHGDLHHPQHLILTEQDYVTFFDKNPLLATFLGNLLIQRTALFVGYSLDDPDFRQIWEIIGSRLGRLRRQAYRLSVKSDAVEVARFERRGVKTISL